MNSDPSLPNEPEREPQHPEEPFEPALGDSPPIEEDDFDYVPVVMPVEPEAKPQPHFGWAILWNLGFAAILFGVMIGIIVVAVVVLLLSGNDQIRKAGAPGEPAIPRPLADALAVSFPLAYLAGLGFALIALRVVAGRDWPRQIGLRRLPPLHVVLVILLVPGFSMMSDLTAQLLKWLFGATGGASQEQALKDMFLPFPWWFAVLAIGIGPGIVEELWCRGFLGRGLVGRYGWPLGILLTSLFFGMLHVYPPWYVLVTATMGVGLHLVYLASKSLWAPMLLHALNNSVAALISIDVLPGGRMENNFVAAPFLVALLAFGVLLFVAVALFTGRVRVVPVDPSLPTWQPPFPGVAHPPPGANGIMRAGRVSSVAVLGAVCTSAALVYLLFR